ncbi:hypothetical protein [Okeania sp. KiyG1]|nr:hypothetical protein [Okeania sp. KiyG1]
MKHSSKKVAAGKIFTPSTNQYYSYRSDRYIHKPKSSFYEAQEN